VNGNVTREQRRVAVKRGIVVGVAGLGIVIASCAGCSDNKSNTGASSTPPPAPAAPQVIVDGKNLNVSGPVTCTPSGNNINIGIGDAANGVGAVVSKDNPPIVHAVGLGTVDGITLGFADAAPGQEGNAGAAANGNSLQIRGTATGPDMSNPQDPKQVSKPFEMDVTCP
jgi:lipoprotein LpqH